MQNPLDNTVILAKQLADKLAEPSDKNHEKKNNENNLSAGKREYDQLVQLVEKYDRQDLGELHLEVAKIVINCLSKGDDRQTLDDETDEDQSEGENQEETGGIEDNGNDDDPAEDEANDDQVEEDELPDNARWLNTKIRDVGSAVRSQLLGTQRSRLLGTQNRGWSKDRNSVYHLGAYLIAEACRLRRPEGVKPTEPPPEGVEPTEWPRLLRWGEGRQSYYLLVPTAWITNALENPEVHARKWCARAVNDPRYLLSAEGLYKSANSFDAQSLLSPEKDQVPPPENLVEAINLLQSCRWKRNDEMVELIRLWDYELKITDKLPIIQGMTKHFGKFTETEKRKKKIRAITEMLDDQKDFTFLYKMDHRGRIYTTQNSRYPAGPQGNDLGRSLLKFSEKIRLGRNGYSWLCNQLATLRISRTRTESEQWVAYHRDKIEDLAAYIRANILSHELNSDAVRQHLLAIEEFLGGFGEDIKGKEFLFIATCLEIARYWEWIDSEKSGEEKSGEEFESDLPVSIDGSCNGFQHIAALTRNSTLAKQTNVFENNQNRPSDFYQHISTLVISVLNINYHEFHKQTFANEPEKRQLRDAAVSEINKAGKDRVKRHRKITVWLKKMRYTTKLLEDIDGDLPQDCAGRFKSKHIVDALSKAITSTQERIRQVIDSQYGIVIDQAGHINPEFRKLIKKVVTPIVYGAGLKSKVTCDKMLKVFIDESVQQAFTELGRVLNDCDSKVKRFAVIVKSLGDQRIKDRITSIYGSDWESNRKLKVFVGTYPHNLLAKYIDKLGDGNGQKFVELLVESKGDFKEFLRKLDTDSHEKLREEMIRNFGQKWEDDKKVKKMVEGCEENSPMSKFIEQPGELNIKQIVEVLGEAQKISKAFFIKVNSGECNRINDAIIAKYGQDWQSNEKFKVFMKHYLKDPSLSKFIDELGDEDAKRRKKDAEIFIELIDWELRKATGDFKTLFSELSKRLYKLEDGISLMTPDGWVVRSGGVKKKTSVKIDEFNGIPVYTEPEPNAEKGKSCGRIYPSRHGFRYDYRVKNRRKKNILGVNYIHALDAYHLRQVLIAANKNIKFQGGLQAIHDSIGTHAGEMEVLHSIVLEEFKKMYRNSPLTQLLQYHRQRLEWAKASFVLRGNGSQEDALEVAEEVENAIQAIEDTYDLEGKLFGEQNDEISPYLFS